MPGSVITLPRRTASAGALLTLGIGLALYQATLLALGPVGNRQVRISLELPRVEGQLPSLPLLTDLDLTLGTVTVPASPLTTVLRSVALQPMPSRSVATLPISIQPVLQSETHGKVPGNARVHRHPKGANYHDADERGLRLARGR